jgi:hypothetical protein
MPQIPVEKAGLLLGSFGPEFFSVPSKRLSLPEGRDGPFGRPPESYTIEPRQQAVTVTQQQKFSSAGQERRAEVLLAKSLPSQGLLTIHEGGRYTAVERQP